MCVKPYKCNVCVWGVEVVSVGVGWRACGGQTTFVCFEKHGKRGQMPVAVTSCKTVKLHF